jgi:hypothetical protein
MNIKKSNYQQAEQLQYIFVFWLIVSQIQLEIRDFEGLKHTIRGDSELNDSMLKRFGVSMDGHLLKQFDELIKKEL